MKQRAMASGLFGAFLALIGCEAGGHGEPTFGKVVREIAEIPSREPASSTSVEPGGRLIYDPNADEMLFVFDGLGAALTVPRRWQEGDVSVEKLVHQMEPGVRAYGVRFHPIDVEWSKAQCLAVIRVYVDKIWDGPMGSERKNEVELARVGGKVYTYATVRDNPMPDGIAASERFDELVISYEDAATQLVVKQRS